MRLSGQIRTLLALGAALALLSISGVAYAEDGGIVPPGGEGSEPDSQADPGYQRVAFGSRALWKGMSGEDVKTLNWLMAALSGETPLDGYFRDPTDQRVRDFQGSAGLASDGVVRKDTRKMIASRMRNNLATWYGPGFFGHRTACGKVLKTTTIGVAHKKLPCGTRVTFAYMGHWVRAKVIDRGPYNGDYKWDLTRKAAKRLGFLGSSTGRLKAAVVR
jgi:rare lipoprotein A (peptidoglycan hydrolase)